MPTNEKAFDCIAYKRRVQQDIYEAIKDMTPEEEIDYFRNAAASGPFADLVRAIDAREHQRASIRSATGNAAVEPK